VRRVTLLFLCSVLTSAARADSIADEADFRFHRAATLYRQGHVEEALGEFLASNRLVRNRNVIFNIARSFEQLGKFNEAYRWYIEVLGDEMPDADRKDLHQALQRLRPSLALLIVESDPPGATVYIDRKDLGARGTTPVTLALPPGKVTALIELQGFKLGQKTTTLSIGKTSLVAPPIERIYGALEVSGEPALFELRLDAQDGPPLLTQSGSVQVLPGRHLLYATAPGHIEQQLAVEVPEEGSAQVQFKLFELPPPSGILVVKANLDGALVRVDGKEVGFTPGVIDNLPVGQHTVEILADGREPVQEKFIVAQNERTFLDVKLRYAQPRVVAAEKALTRAQDAPASITVITADELRGFGYTTLSEALRSVRGLYTTSDRDYDSLGVRGFSSPGTYNNRVLVLSDGHNTNEASVGQGSVGRDFDADLSNVERIEVVRGPGSVLYGSAAFFGVINVVHKTPAEGTHAEAFAQVGTLGENTGHAFVSLAGQGGSLSVRASGANLLGEEFFAPAGAPGVAQGLDKEWAGHLDLRARLGDFSLLASFNSRRKTLPTGAFDTTFGRDGTATLDHRGFVEGSYGHTSESGLGVDARVSYDDESYRGTWQYNVVGPGADSSREQWGTAEVRLRLPPVLHSQFFVGGEVQDRWNVHLTSYTPGALYFDNAPGNGGGFPNSEIIASVYAGDDWRIGKRLQLDAAVRLDDYLEQFPANAPKDVAQNFGYVVNPRLALIAQPYDDGTTKLLLGRAFRAPGFYERFFNDGGQSQIAATDCRPDPSPCNRSLKPETVTSAELEHSHQLNDEVLLLGTVYFSQIDQLVRAGVVDLGGGNLVSQFQNRSGFVHSVGAEAEVRWQAGPGVVFSAWYAWSLVRDDSGTSLFQGKPVANSPVHTAAVRVLRPLLPQVLSLSSEAIYNGPRHSVSDASRPDALVGESLLWNAGLSGEYARWGLRYGAFVQNILDQRLTLPGGPEIPFTSHAVPQIGRTLKLQLALAF